MKKRTFLTTLSVIAVSLLFAACRNLTSTPSISSRDKCYIKIYCDAYELTRARQTFFPVGPENEEGLENFVLKGTKAGGTEVTLKTWTDYDELRSSDPVEIDRGIWTLILTADYEGNTCYGAKNENIEIIPGEITPITFKLVPLANGTGKVEVSLTWAVANNQVACVKAGMFDTDGNENPYFPVEEISFAKDVDDDTLYCATYSKGSVPIGSYILKFYLYRDAAGTDLINAFTYGIQVAGDLWTGGVVQITMLNYKWKLTLDTNGGSWRRGVVITLDTFNEFDYVTLPGKSSIKLDEYSFRGWTLDPADPTAEVFTSWEPGKMSDDVTLYASWKELRDTVWIFLKGDDPGDDGNDGLDSSRPLRTLGRAIELIKEDYSDAKVNIMVMTAYTLADGEENSFDLANDFDVPVKIVRDQNVGDTLFVIDASKLSNANLKFTNVTIEGNKANITVSNPTSLIKVLGTASNKAVVTLGMDATLQNNKSTSNGAGIYLNQYAELKMLDGSSITGNEVSGNSAYGDGIYSDGGTVEMNGGAVKGPEGATEYRSGHGIHMNGGALTVTGGEISGNRGSGLYNAKGTLSVEPEAGKSVEIKGNKGYGIYASGATATLDKGSGDRLEVSGNGSYGIYNYASGAAATLTVTGALVSGNGSYGIYNYASGAAATLTVTGALVSGNGGGIYNYAYSADATATLTDTDITDNTFTGICSVAGSWTYRAKVALSGTTKVNGNSATGSDYASGGGVYCNGYYYSSSSYYPETCVLEVGEDVEISGNKARISGGGIYCKCATVTIDGGKVKDNTAREGGGIYCAVGSVVTLKNYADVGGNTAFWESTSAGNGGGIYIAAGGAVALGECEVIGNTAVAESTYSGSSSSYYAIAYGGGVYNEGTLSVSGGEVKGNTASATATAMSLARGNGIYNNATLNMSGAAKIDSDNDIYILASSSKTITVTGALTSSGIVGVITPNKYVRDIQVITNNEFVDSSYTKFEISPAANGELWEINSIGRISQTDDASIIFLDITQGSDTYAGTSETTAVQHLKAAIEKLSGTNPTIVFVKPYTLGADEKDCLKFDSKVTFRRFAAFTSGSTSCTGNMLTIDSSVTSTESAPIEISNIIFDGNKSKIASANGVLLNIDSGTTSGFVKIAGDVVVQDNGGTGVTIGENANVNVESGAVIKNNIVGISNSGTLTVDGVKITSNSGNGINNTGTLTVNNAATEINSNSYGIRNNGASATVTINNGTISQNKSGGIYNENKGTVTLNNGTITKNKALSTSGAGIYNTGSGSKLYIKGGSITDHTITYTSSSYVNVYGAGIYNSSGAVEITGGTISGNKVEHTYYASYAQGGGIYNSGTLTISGGTIENNTASYGAGIYNNSTFTLEPNDDAAKSPVIKNNTATYYGGGIYNNRSTFTISGGKIESNSAAQGGGIYNGSTSSGGSLTISGGTIENNSATYYGGGIYNSNSTLTISGGTISNNSSATGEGIYHYSSSSSYKLNMKDDAIIDDSNDVYLVNSSSYSYITISGTINGGTGKIANITMANYNNSYTNVFNANSGVEQYLNRFELSDSSYCLTKSGNYGILAKKGAKSNVALPSYTLTLKKRPSATSSSYYDSTLSSTSTLSSGNVVLFSLGSYDEAPAGAKYKIAVMQGGTEIPKLTKTVDNLNDAKVTIPESLVKLNPTVSVYAAVIITVGGKEYVYDTRVDKIKVR